MQRAVVVLVLVAGLGCRKDLARQDLDGDGVTAADGDCAPGDPTSLPGAAEVCDGHDNNCDGAVDEGAGATFYPDGDGDGYGVDGTGVPSCVAPDGQVAFGGDCDDADAQAHPGAIESCEVLADLDCDGVPSGEDGDGDGVPECLDCDDGDPLARPGGAETCDGADEDCDGEVDEGASDAPEWFVDLDGDGVGSSRVVVTACDAPAGFVADDGDCDDLSVQVFPGAPELCDGRDNDCDAAIDDGAKGVSVWWADGDGDGYGDPDAEQDACAQPVGHVGNPDDCDDTDARFHPDAAESCADPRDYNCDGAVGEADGDGDGTPACTDCDDKDATVHPGAAEVCDLADNDCDGATDENAPTWYADVDGDGHGGKQLSVVQCVAPGGFVASNDDCDDLSGEAFPGATELCNGRDDDCVGGVSSIEADADADRWRGCDGDCADTDSTAFPGALEVCDGKDDDCDGTADDDPIDAVSAYTDADGDGFGGGPAGAVCALGAGQVSTGGDCDDGAKGTFPGATEVCNGVDDNCDASVDVAASDATRWYVDQDGDGFGVLAGSTTACTQPAGTAAVPGDCNDASKGTSPVADELCSTVGVDDDCDGQKDEASASDAAPWFQDADGDKHGTPANFTIACAQPAGRVAAGDDCNDANAKIYAGATETWYDGVDQNCDGASDFDQDGDGLASNKFGGSDCDDTNKLSASCDGSSKAAAGLTCKSIKAAFPSSASGTFWIDPDGDGNTGNAFQVYCDQTTDGGGWTLITSIRSTNSMTAVTNSTTITPASDNQTNRGMSLPGVTQVLIVQDGQEPSPNDTAFDHADRYDGVSGIGITWQQLLDALNVNGGATWSDNSYSTGSDDAWQFVASRVNTTGCLQTALRGAYGDGNYGGFNGGGYSAIGSLYTHWGAETWVSGVYGGGNGVTMPAGGDFRCNQTYRAFSTFWKGTFLR